MAMREKSSRYCHGLYAYEIVRKLCGGNNTSDPRTTSSFTEPSSCVANVGTPKDMNLAG